MVEQPFQARRAWPCELGLKRFLAPSSMVSHAQCFWNNVQGKSRALSHRALHLDAGICLMFKPPGPPDLDNLGKPTSTACTLYPADHKRCRCGNLRDSGETYRHLCTSQTSRAADRQVSLRLTPVFYYRGLGNYSVQSIRCIDNMVLASVTTLHSRAFRDLSTLTG